MELPELINLADEIRSRLEKGRGLRWPSEFKSEILKQTQNGVSIKELSKVTGITGVTLRNWVEPKAIKKSQFQAVNIIDGDCSDLILCWSGGLEVRGLNFENFRELLREGLL